MLGSGIFSVKLIRFLDLLKPQLLFKFHHLFYLKKVPKLSMDIRPMYRKQKSVNWKTNGPCIIQVPRNFQKWYFFMEHHLFFKLRTKFLFWGPWRWFWSEMFSQRSEIWEFLNTTAEGNSIFSREFPIKMLFCMCNIKISKIW